MPTPNKYWEGWRRWNLTSGGGQESKAKKNIPFFIYFLSSLKKKKNTGSKDKLCEVCRIRKQNPKQDDAWIYQTQTKGESSFLPAVGHLFLVISQKCHNCKQANRISRHNYKGNVTTANEPIRFNTHNYKRKCHNSRQAKGNITIADELKQMSQLQTSQSDFTIQLQNLQKPLMHQDVMRPAFLD